jgi:hypothetical protein
MKQIILIIVILNLAASCSIIDSYYCRENESDDLVFRKYAEASSTNQQLSEEKALLIAKQEIAIEVDNYIMSKFNHQTFLADPDFEAKITTARKTILTNINIICSRTVERKGMFKSFLTIEISKKDIDAEVEKRLKEEIR